MTNNFHTIQIKVKPYVRKYLTNNCGNPVLLHKLPELNSFFLTLLQKPLFRFETKNVADYSTHVQVAISEDTFRRWGYEISKTNQLLFNNKVEMQLKFIMRTWVTQRAALGFPVATVIRQFQDRFSFPEEIWTYEAIKKDLDRHTDTKKSADVENFLKEMEAKMHHLFVENMSALGTITKQYRNELSEI